MLKHFQSEHELNLFDLKLTQQDLELIHVLQANNLVLLSQSVRVKKRCFIKIPPSLINPLVNAASQVTKLDLIDKELKLLNEIYKEQIVEKQIVSWLNSEQFLRRNFNYNSYVCIICNATKNHILETHYLNKQTMPSNLPSSGADSTQSSHTQQSSTNRNQFYSDEMKTVVLTNHVLSHFNEYCYRCMSCKISWPDRTQLLKHSQECPNSQVVRTKTKYKLKANCRLQLKFYLQSYIDYWQHEKMLEQKLDLSISTNTTTNNNNNNKKLNCKVYLNDIIINKNLLLNASGRFNVNTINLEGKQMLLKDDDETDSNDITTTTTNTTSNATTTTLTTTSETNNEQTNTNDNKNDVLMKEDQTEKD